MAQNIFSRLGNRIANAFGFNKFNYAFLQQVGGDYTSYDQDASTYLEKGYNYNSVVYSIISQQSTKTSSIPFEVKKIDDEKSKRDLTTLYRATKYNLTPIQQVKKRVLENKAFSDEVFDMPLEKPNVNQTWSEFHALYKTFLALTGNVYIYLLSPEDGMNAGTPTAVYLLPSHNVKIVTKPNSDLLGIENPIKSFMLIEGNQYVEFDAEKVIHIKLSNPNYNEDGEHLYGQSRLRSALRNLQSSNTATDLNNKTLESGGAFGFFFGKNQALTPEQAKGFKERLTEMQNDPGTLAKIAGSSVEMGFQRISLTTDELKPFDYLSYNEKQLCNALGWSDKLLNNDAGAKYDNVNQFRKQVVTDNILPDLQLLAEALNSHFLPLFKGYENTEIVYDISELPEMQEDTEKMVNWAVQLLDRGTLNRNEVRDIVTFNKVEDDNMDVYTVNNDLLTLDEAIDSEFRIEGA